MKCLLVVVLAASTAATLLARTALSAEQPTRDDPTLAVRTTLAGLPPAQQLVLAVQLFKQQDPAASFTWLRGHVDAFVTQPKPSIPDYARPVLLAHGVSADAILQPKESTTTSPPSPNGTPNPP